MVPVLPTKQTGGREPADGKGAEERVQRKAIPREEANGKTQGASYRRET